MTWQTGALYSISYTNLDDETSNRVIRIIKVTKTRKGTVYIRAFCYMRNEERTFSEDRIIRAQLIASEETPGQAVYPAKEYHQPVSQTPTLYPSYSSPSYPVSMPAASLESQAQKSAASSKYELGASAAPSIHESKMTATPLMHESRTTTAPAPLSSSSFSEPFIHSKVSPYSSDYFTRDFTTSKNSNTSNSKPRHGFAKLLRVVFTVIAVLVVLNKFSDGEMFSWLQHNVVLWAKNSSTNTTPLYRTIPVTPPAPPKPVVPTVEEVKLGGLILRTHRDASGTWYEVPARGYKGTSKREAIKTIRVPNFINYTGINDTALINRYLMADTDNNGKLSFMELEQFAQKVRTYVSYMHNDTALRPDIFLKEGGGDCEDFALYIAGLLRFWGWQPYIACFGPPDDGSGHAVCFSYEGSGGFPSSYTYYILQGKTAWDGTPLPDGKYIPIDFEEVGRLSNAVRVGWVLEEIFIPEKTWGMKL